jgi:hypothetical protein
MMNYPRSKRSSNIFSLSPPPFLFWELIFFSGRIRELVKMVQTKCEIYSRVVGYIRPVEQWHDGKQAEFHDRKKFSTEEKQTVIC